ncbi:hypothetical protein, partial [Klebsiella pneumoniae]|uniref:hypothetical protein n=1 Tax=Klebsiella pneumoniae TaxID=573 RepID=UPI001D0E1056
MARTILDRAWIEQALISPLSLMIKPKMADPARASGVCDASNIHYMLEGSRENLRRGRKKPSVNGAG